MNVSKAIAANISNRENGKVDILSRHDKSVSLDTEHSKSSEDVVRTVSDDGKDSACLELKRSVDTWLNRSDEIASGVIYTLDGIKLGNYLKAGATTPFSKILAEIIGKFTTVAAGISAVLDTVCGLGELAAGIKLKDRQLIVEGASDLGFAALWGAMTAGAVGAVPATVGFCVLTGVKIAEAIHKAEKDGILDKVFKRSVRR